MQVPPPIKQQKRDCQTKFSTLSSGEGIIFVTYGVVAKIYNVLGFTIISISSSEIKCAQSAQKFALVFMHFDMCVEKSRTFCQFFDKMPS